MKLTSIGRHPQNINSELYQWPQVRYHQNLKLIEEQVERLRLTFHIKVVILFLLIVFALGQTFHICADDGNSGLFKYSFLCPNGTLFNQEYFICDWWFNVDCSIAEDFFSLNAEIAEAAANANTAREGRSEDDQLADTASYNRAISDTRQNRGK
jgi:hypothetical protein